MKDLEKEFKPTSWAIDNKVAIYVATVIITLVGIITYNSLPKESFPEVVFPQIHVSTPDPAAEPKDIENLITKHIEKQMKSLTGVKKMTSNSVQDFSNVIIEFQTDVSISDAKRDVKDAVDRAKPDLPTDLPDDPQVIDIDISAFPIMFVNLSGDYDLQTLKRYAEMMQDRIEAVKQIRRADIAGALDREIQINVDLYKAALAGVSMNDVFGSISSENVIVPGGQLAVGGMKRSLSVSGEYKSAEEIGNTVVGSIRGGKIYLHDIAQVLDTHKEQESFARLNKKNVVTLQIVKRSGENLILASDAITEIIKDYKANVLPPGLNVTITADQSENTRTTLHDLINTIIIGFILVTITLIIALMASLIVAYIINPVFAADFMQPHDHDHENPNKSKFTKGFKITGIVFASVALMSYIVGAIGLGNLAVLLFILYALHHFFISKVISKFQTSAWPAVQASYKNFLQWCLVKYRPIWIMSGVFFLFIFSIWFTGVRKPPVVFFPNGDPNFIYAFIRMPIGTDQKVTDSITSVVEDRIIKVLTKDGKLDPIVESVISNVAVGAAEDPTQGGVSPHLGKVGVGFVKYAARHGQSTAVYMDQIREGVKGVKGAEISVDQEKGGPPTAKPISIEIAADDFDQLVGASTRLKRYLDSLQIPGIEELKSDFQSDKPEIKIAIDREKANREGISTTDIGRALGTAVFGVEVSRFRDENDDYPIELRILPSQRNDVNALMSLPITYRDMSMGGQVRQVPLSAFATVAYTNSFAGIKRIDQKRVVTLSSNVLGGFNENEVVAEIKSKMESFAIPDGVTVDMTGAQEEQAETASFLVLAFCLAFGMITMILVLQFNSISKPLIILSEIVFSIIGVLIGFSLFRLEISIVMTGIGIMALSGLVVGNGILLVEFTDLLRAQGFQLKEAITEAAKTRMTPVMLTTTAATIGLIPLGVGLNIDFVTLFTELNPHIFFGGDNVAFWGPLAWTMIFGLLFGTFLTLVLVPVLYLLFAKLKERIFKFKVEPVEDKA